MAAPATSIPTPPATPPPASSAPLPDLSLIHTVPVLSPQANPSDLVLHIDSLLETYLHNLDQYSKLREELSKDLSNGFLSLAHANRTTTTGRRYGEECYDERMKAGRRVEVHLVMKDKKNLPMQECNEETEDSKSKLRTKSSTSDGNFDINNSITKFSIASLYPQKQPLPKLSKVDTNDSTCETSNSNPSPLHTSSNPTPSEPPSLRDPILQFGILIPPSLRTAQKSFIGAISSVIPELLNVTERMKWLEAEIERARRALESSEQVADDEDDNILSSDIGETKTRLPENE
ncbi:hypothetical protein UCRPC4_g03752 [Phaeomoniella chlamydospora]|uniref:Vacuolar ATPase assembly protein VMA22 n=1 Tax=Phaeomoniella chlamydospora TaxID=158046 RepID=A0A0G2EGD5_PHACM|nr:hypothetical protein UCRPC4_g03752 [Phaeomoniella chlamydospora]